MVNIDLASNIAIYSLSTVAATYQLSVEQVGIINRADNANGISSTVTAWHNSLLPPLPPLLDV